MTLSDKPDLTNDLRVNVIHTETLKAFAHLSSSLFLFRDFHVTLGKEATCQCRRSGFDLWVRKILWRRKQQHTPVFLAGKYHGQKSLVGYSPWGCKSQTQLND